MSSCKQCYAVCSYFISSSVLGRLHCQSIGIKNSNTTSTGHLKHLVLCVKSKTLCHMLSNVDLSDTEIFCYMLHQYHLLPITTSCSGV